MFEQGMRPGARRPGRHPYVAGKNVTARPLHAGPITNMAPCERAVGGAEPSAPMNARLTTAETGHDRSKHSGQSIPMPLALLARHPAQRAAMYRARAETSGGAKIVTARPASARRAGVGRATGPQGCEARRCRHSLAYHPPIPTDSPQSASTSDHHRQPG